MNVVIIPARGGSKRIPRKNIKPFLGKEIIAYSIEAAIQTRYFDKVIVSTDDEEIAKVARKYGAVSDHLRPDSLSNDFVGTSEVIKYEIKRLTKNGWNLNLVCELYPTAPLIKSEYLDGAVEVLEALRKNAFVFSAIEFEFPVQRGFEIINGHCKALEPKAFSKRSQDLNPIYHDAGQFYLARKEAWMNYDMRFNEMSVPQILKREEAIDIDNESDWKIAEAIARYKNL